MIVINTNTHNGKQKGVNIFYAAPILSGAHVGKFATSENALKEFPEIFANLDYEVAELEARDFEIDTTPPQLSTLRVAIPQEWEIIFPDDKFIINGFEVQLERVKGVLAVDVAYLDWQPFKDELDKPENATVKRSLEGVWDYVKKQYDLHNFI
jgi:hypothetical protein